MLLSSSDCLASRVVGQRRKLSRALGDCSSIPRSVARTTAAHPHSRQAQALAPAQNCGVLRTVESSSSSSSSSS